MIDIFLVHLKGGFNITYWYDDDGCWRAKRLRNLEPLCGGTNENREILSWCCVRADDRTRTPFFLFCPLIICYIWSVTVGCWNVDTSKSRAESPDTIFFVLPLIICYIWSVSVGCWNVDTSESRAEVTWKILKCSAGVGRRRSVWPIVWGVKKCCIESISKGISYIQ